MSDHGFHFFSEFLTPKHTDFHPVHATPVCNTITLPITPIVVHIPCVRPQPSCPQPPVGPGNSYLGNLPGTNAQIHYSKG